MNYNGVPENFILSGQKFQLPGFKTDQIYYRQNLVKTPFGNFDYIFRGQGFTWGTPGSEKWFVMALFPVWKREYNDKISMWYGMLSHEMFHPYQFSLPGIKEKLDRLDESTFTKFYKLNTAFAKEVDLEFGHLKKALTATQDTVRKAEVRKFLELRDTRRKKFLTQAPFVADEAAMETAEGVAEYMNYRVMIDSKKFDVNEKLKSIDPDFDQYAVFRKFSEKEALKKMEATNSYVQKIGVFTVILLNKINPNWPKRIHTEYGEALLREFAGDD